MAVVLPLLTTYNAAGVKQAQASLSGLGAVVSKLGKTVALGTVAFQGMQGAINFAGDAVAQARDLERNMSALSTVFGNLAPRMQDFASNAYNMGLSQVEAARTSTFLGSVLKQAGLPMDQVASKTEELTILAQDLATTYGYDTSEALTAMTALFRGEYDPIEKFGVALKQNEVNALVAAKGLGKLTGQALLNAQQQVRMEQLFIRSADASGAFARQSGTLFVEQKKLTAVFANMEAQVGSQLTPALAGLMRTLTPIVSELTPSLSTGFATIGRTIESLAPMLEPLGGILVELIDIVNGVGIAFVNMLDKIAPELLDTLNTLEGLIQHVGNGFDGLTTILEDTVNAFLSLPEGPVTQFLDNVFIKAGRLLDVLNPIGYALKLIKNVFPSTDQAPQANDPSWSRYGALQDFIKKKTAYDLRQQQLKNLQNKNQKDPVKEFYKDLADEIAKESAKLKLKSLGATEEFIQTIIGSGSDWKKVFNNVLATGRAGITKLQSDFNRTAAGRAAIAKVLEQEAKDKYDAAMEQYRKDLEVYNEQKRLYDAQVEAIKNFKKEIQGITASLLPISVATREIGAFEQSVVDAFTNIGQTIADALDNGNLTTNAADQLKKYASTEKQALLDIAKRRDELVNKRSLAQGILTDVKAAIVGLGDITKLIEQQTEKVTVSTTKMVGDLKVITTRTVDQVVNSGGLVESFKSVLTKTKAFAEQLKQLRALGLDQNLYKQIVDAGVDAGSVTAKEIIDGGANTVAELNNVFAELNTAGASIAEQTAQVMYGAGVDVTQGIIAGLISQEQLLVDQATTMAQAFIDAFNTKMKDFVVPTLTNPTAPVEPVLSNFSQAADTTATTLTYTLADIKKQLTAAGSPAQSAANAALAAKLIASPAYTAYGTTITVNVNAGLGANGKTIGQAIQAELNKYAKANV